MRRTTALLILILLSLGAACQKDEQHIDPEPPVESDYRKFATVNELNALFDKLAALPDSLERVSRLNALWDSLRINKQIPFALDDSALFLYRGSAAEVAWAGDFNRWDPTTHGFQGERIGQSNFFRMKQQFPGDARLDYKLVVGSNWLLDPANAYVQYSGFGPNSELRMPDWTFPEETLLAEDVNRGTFSQPFIISSHSGNLGYDVQYRVYTPFGYEALTELPLVYVTDGHEYADDRLGAMLIVLDNLIHSGEIEPVIAVFIDPRNPANTSQNRRMSEYRANPRFVGFVADELVPHIDSQYKTDTAANRRAILGTSLGGWNSAYFGIERPDVFGLVGIHSPAFDELILQRYTTAELLPIKVFMSTGVINDTEVRARQMQAIMESKGYPLHYVEVNQGHSWGNWRALLAAPLQWFFGLER